MCYVAAIPYAIAAIGAAASTYGAVQSSNAQQKSANAIAAQNTATQQAQQQAFVTRLGAQSNQSDQQTAIAQQMLADRNAAANQMRAGQSSALDQQAQLLARENAQAEALRGQGDAQAQTLLANTSGANLAAAQDQARQQATALLAASQDAAPPSGLTAGDPSGDASGSSDPATRAAVATRLNQAATKVRDYGTDIAKVASYQQPVQVVGQAIGANKVGIMPAAAADQLLRNGAGVRLLPSQIAYQNATGTGGTLDTLLQSRGQGQLNLAGLDYGNTVSSANLGQSDADTLAANKAAQAKADAAYAQQVAGIYSGIGQLGLYGAGYLGGNPLGGGSNVPGSTVAMSSTGRAAGPV
jgi:hypothetical protein